MNERLMQLLALTIQGVLNGSIVSFELVITLTVVLLLAFLIDMRIKSWHVIRWILWAYSITGIEISFIFNGSYVTEMSQVDQRMLGRITEVIFPFIWFLISTLLWPIFWLLASILLSSD